MKPTPWNTRFFASTRGKIVSLLRRTGHTVHELAEALHLSDNAVRGHITTLERDSLVRPSGTRRGFRKPTTVYGLTPEAEALFPKACGLLLQPILTLLSERLPAEEMESLLRDAGRQLAASRLPRKTDISAAERLEHALAVLGDLGGLAEAEQRDGHLLVRGSQCPFSAAVFVEPRVCLAAETLLGDLLAAPVKERCDRSEAPHCYFEISMPPG